MSESIKPYASPAAGIVGLPQDLPRIGMIMSRARRIFLDQRRHCLLAFTALLLCPCCSEMPRIDEDPENCQINPLYQMSRGSPCGLLVARETSLFGYLDSPKMIHDVGIAQLFVDTLKGAKHRKPFVEVNDTVPYYVVALDKHGRILLGAESSSSHAYLYPVDARQTLFGIQIVAVHRPRTMDDGESRNEASRRHNLPSHHWGIDAHQLIRSIDRELMQYKDR